MRPVGFKHTEETKRRIGLSNKGKGGFKKGHKVTKQTIIHCRNLGLNNKGKKFSNEINKKKGHPREKNPSWKGGVVLFEKELRERIRERDNCTCQICGKIKTKRKLNVHHIDYNKKNSRENNLITLCDKCHNNTQKNRELWIIFFKKLMRKL